MMSVMLPGILRGSLNYYMYSCFYEVGVVQRSPYYPWMLPVGEGVVRAECAVIPLAPVRVIGWLHDGVVPARHQALGVTCQQW